MTSTKYKLHIAESAMLIALSITLCLALWGQGTQSKLAGGLIRLHVIAHSDSEYEQALKLRVRDAVLSCAAPLLENAKDAGDAERTLLAHIDDIKLAAVSAAEGRSVEVSLTLEAYPTRFYGSFALPAGEYTSLRVMLGSAEGQNWWCVVFPPLCSGASTAAAEEVLGSDGARLITRDGAGYMLKFRSAELWNELKKGINGN